MYLQAKINKRYTGILKIAFRFLNSIEGWADKAARESTPKSPLESNRNNKRQLRYVNKYVGGELFQGLEIIWFKEILIQSMSYRVFG